MLSDDADTKAWGCRKCKDSGYASGDKLRVARNCDRVSNPNIAWEWAPTLKRCPWSQIDARVAECFRWWQDWRTLGVLPWRGELIDQPIIVFDVLNLCESIRLELEASRWQAKQK